LLDLLGESLSLTHKLSSLKALLTSFLSFEPQVRTTHPLISKPRRVD